ncbi:MAG: hypothetical protein ACOC1K_02360 [Nanoarchaeota archaeon]
MSKKETKELIEIVEGGTYKTFNKCIIRILNIKEKPDLVKFYNVSESQNTWLPMKRVNEIVVSKIR